MVRSATARAEEQARRIETQARGEAAKIVSEAEARATARTRQIEQWAEQVVSHTRAEEARLQHEQQLAKEASLAELRDLSDQRGRAIGSLNALREALGRAAGLVDKDPAGAAVAGATRPAPDTAANSSNGAAASASAEQPATEPASTPNAQASSPDQDGPATETSRGDEAGSAPPEGDHLDATVATLLNGGATETEQFEAKLDAWVSGGPEDRIG